MYKLPSEKNRYDFTPCWTALRMPRAVYFKSFKCTWQTTISFFIAVCQWQAFVYFFPLGKFTFKLRHMKLQWGRMIHYQSVTMKHTAMFSHKRKVLPGTWPVGKNCCEQWWSTTPKNTQVIHRAPGNSFLCSVVGWSTLTDGLIHLWVVFHSCKSRELVALHLLQPFSLSGRDSEETFPILCHSPKGRVAFVASCDMRCRIPLPQRVRSDPCLLEQFGSVCWSSCLGQTSACNTQPAEGNSRFFVAVISIRKQNEEKREQPQREAQAGICTQIRFQTAEEEAWSTNKKRKPENSGCSFHTSCAEGKNSKKPRVPVFYSLDKTEHPEQIWRNKTHLKYPYSA